MEYIFTQVADLHGACYPGEQSPEDSLDEIFEQVPAWRVSASAAMVDVPPHNLIKFDLCCSSVAR